MECPTPYNSLYDCIKNTDNNAESRRGKSRLICCLHGNLCDIGAVEIAPEKKDELTEQYVNLLNPKTSEKNMKPKKIISTLVDKLRDMEYRSACPKQKRSRERKKDRKKRHRKTKDDDSQRKECCLNVNSEKCDFNISQSYKETSEDRSKSVSEDESKHSSRSIIKKEKIANNMEIQDSDESKSRSEEKVKNRQKKKKKKTSANNPHIFESMHDLVKTSAENNENRWNLNFPSESAEGGTAKSIYIGVCNFAKAEEQVVRRTDFRLYHRLVHRPLLDELEQELPLILVYKTANGSYRHYPIRTRKVGDSTYYYVDYGDPKAKAHVSLDHLVRYYQINVHRHPRNQDYADPFPWWECNS